MKVSGLSGYPLNYQHGDAPRDFVTGEKFVRPTPQGCKCHNANGTPCCNHPLPGTDHCFVHSISFCAPISEKLLTAP